MLKYFFFLALALFIAPANAADRSGHAEVNGLEMYFQIHDEVHGDLEDAKPPLVMLHGGLCTIESCMANLVQEFAGSQTLVLVEQQGHGRTADIDRPLTYEQMADDTVALLRKLDIGKADFFGYSDGGGVALSIAMQYPEQVRRLAVFGTGYSNDGLRPGLLDAFKTMKAEDIPAMFRDAYMEVAPQPEHWPMLVEKVLQHGLDFEGWSHDELKSIQSPALVMIGDEDIVLPEHVLEMSRLIPDTQLAILPGTGHFGPMQRADWVADMTRAFLDAPAENENQEKE